ncbi:hypothetical protein BN136_3725 [Cronobacter universalis NCTC 9529]|nr:hypothetical protein BN136_3725 [Cronobacter universalis NCTC 9529]
MTYEPCVFWRYGSRHRAIIDNHNHCAGRQMFLVLLKSASQYVWSVMSGDGNTNAR